MAISKEQREKLDRYRILNQSVREGEILFTGSSLMEQTIVNITALQIDCRLYRFLFYLYMMVLLISSFQAI